MRKETENSASLFQRSTSEFIICWRQVNLFSICALKHVLCGNIFTQRPFFFVCIGKIGSFPACTQFDSSGELHRLQSCVKYRQIE